MEININGMTGFRLNKETEANIKKNTGLPVDEIRIMDIEDVDRCVERKIGKKLEFRSPKSGLPSSRPILLNLGRVL